MSITIIKKQKRIPVYDVTVKNTNNFYANGILVHNCVEITLPTSELTRHSSIPFDKNIHIAEFSDVTPKDFREKYGEIALCTLGSLNLGRMKKEEDIENACDLIVRGLDELLDYQDYPMLAAGIPATKRRALGVGVSNLAYFLAKNNCKYSDGSANDLVNEYAEKISYYLIKASVELAKEKGKCDWFDETKYAKGILPIDTYKKAVDGVLKTPNYMNWEPLRKEIVEHGMRNSTIMALMPVESCLVGTQQIKTDTGNMDFYAIIKKAGLDVNDIIKNGKPGWYDISHASIKIRNDINMWQPVERLYYNGKVVVDTIIMEDKHSIAATPPHKFKVLHDFKLSWCCVADLKEGYDILTFENGITTSMKVNKIIRATKVEHTFDLEVNETHSYQLSNGNVSHNSSQVINATNGIEPPRAPVSIKVSKDGTLKQVVPEIHKLKNKYEYLWDMPHTRGYLEIAAIFQKWADQAISTNTSYNPINYLDNKVPMSELIKDLIYAYKLGIKTLYYQNTNDGAGELFSDDAPKDDDDSCDSCVL